ncbi:superoxide dismutase family protein [Allosphingosinicella indica]|uniref:Superoxide dismutase, Cu-Zn family n=1 Tax=Allosphingosinicella indica TaxID=941907 RepID=A0A1X7GE30_9SPHN|nr:superoxide dismutase family protein [Allosphingosinicella indica]SMF68162.1 superoxide dismutase, Cu-Zn family [Allosphingosinicella indica]
MKAMVTILGAAAILATAACTTAGDGGSAEVVSANAGLLDADGQSRGNATASQAGNDIRVRVNAMGFPPGSHGLHVHTVGQCTPPSFDSAGGHWNPGKMQHGKDNASGPHMGDLPNIVIGSDGRGTVEFTIKGAMVRGGAAPMLDADGAAIVIHATADDYRTDPTGNSGARIACGVFG